MYKALLQVKSPLLHAPKVAKIFIATSIPDINDKMYRTPEQAPRQFSVLSLYLPNIANNANPMAQAILQLPWKIAKFFIIPSSLLGQSYRIPVQI